MGSRKLRAMQWLCAGVLGVMAAPAQAGWTAPANPDPLVIYDEALADARAGRYEDALAKHLWFHHNALQHRRSLYGVRLSFALSSWMDLGRNYPPARDALRRVRDEAQARVRQGSGGRNDFADVSAINEAFGEHAATGELFAWLDEHRPELAKASYPVAEKALIRTKQYRLCGKYVDAESSLERILRLHREHQRMIASGTFGESLREFAEESFAHQASTLVALLTLNERGAEADRVIAAVLQEKPEAALKSRVERARAGEVPKPWP